MTWYDTFVQSGVFERLFRLIPVLVVYVAIPFAFPHYEWLKELTRHVVSVYMIVVVALAINSALTVSVEVYLKHTRKGHLPIKAYVQVAQIVVFIAMTILLIATLVNRSPWALLSGFGVMTAVIMLVFKDSIVGFVASVQLAVDDIVRCGDWVEMPQYGADGDVIDISINTVKVQNWDKTVTTIPTYRLMQEGVKNWRGMSESGGRRIKRAIYIDVSSIRFCDPELIARFEDLHLLHDYIAEKRKELDVTNDDNGLSNNPTNLRRLTNVGTFRAYVIAYLKIHSKIMQNMTFLVRHLPLTDRGLPIEIYVFSSDQVWANYEEIQADLFEHLLAVLPEFDLRVFQLPSGHNVTDVLAGTGNLRN